MARKKHAEIEKEIKIALSRKDLEKVFRSFSKKMDKDDINHKYLPREYYDTTGMKFFKNGISVRVQYRSGKRGFVGGYEQTVKFEMPPDKKIDKSTLIRRECKDVVPKHRPNLNLISDKIARRKMQPFKKEKLKHIFTAAIERRYFNIELGHGKHRGVVEVAFDIGEIILPGGEKRYPFAEIEIEMKGGSPEVIAEVRKRIMKIAKSARTQKLSKSGQGTRAYLLSRHRPKP